MRLAAGVRQHRAVGRRGRDRDDQVAEREIGLQTAAGSDAHEALDAELDELLVHDRGARAAHARRLHRDPLALERPGVAEHPALGVDLPGVLEEGLGDVAGAQGVARNEHRIGIVARLGAKVNRHGRRCYSAGIGPDRRADYPQIGAQLFRRFLPTATLMGAHLKRGTGRLLAVLALLALPAGAFADATPAPAPRRRRRAASTSSRSLAPTPLLVLLVLEPRRARRAARSRPARRPPQLAAQKKAAKARGAEEGRRSCKAARIAARQGEGRPARKARRSRPRGSRPRSSAAQKKAAAEHARLVAQQQHAEDTAEATFAQALQRDDAFRFATSAADSIGASAAVQAAPLDAADATPRPRVRLLAVQRSTDSDVRRRRRGDRARGRSAYAVRARAWRVAR